MRVYGLTVLRGLRSISDGFKDPHNPSPCPYATKGNMATTTTTISYSKQCIQLRQKKNDKIC